MMRSINVDTIQQEVDANKASVRPVASHLNYVIEEIRSSNEHLKKATILLVDDEVQSLRGLSRVLHKQPYTFFTVRSVDEAIEVIQRQSVDVVVTDQKMPGKSGTDLAVWIARFCPEIKTIMLTGCCDERTASDEIKQGHIFRFFVKPCDASELMIAIDAAIEEKRNSAEHR